MSLSVDAGSLPALILIVDDEQDNRELLKIMLKWEGFATLTASNGEDAVALAIQAQPQLILLDLMMPGLDGYAVTTLLKASVLTQHIPVLIVSAMSDCATQQRALGLGAEGLVAKPFSRAAMCQRVRDLLFTDSHAVSV